MRQGSIYRGRLTGIIVFTASLLLLICGSLFPKQCLHEGALAWLLSIWLAFPGFRPVGARGRPVFVLRI